jgi:hypothetical protein
MLQINNMEKMRRNQFRSLYGLERQQCPDLDEDRGIGAKTQ